MAQVEITDDESLKAWLKTRPAADDDILAARIGLRVFPLWGWRMERDWAVKKKLTALPILRILLIKSISQGDKDKYNRAKARMAAALAAALAADADDAAAAAANVAHADVVTSTGYAPPYAYAQRILWAAVSANASALQNGQDPSHLHLWHDAPPDWWEFMMGEAIAIWDKDPETWVFWRRWLDGMIAGQPLPFDLLDAVASIGESVWEAGPEAVATRIDLLVQRRALRSEAAAIKAKLIEFGLLNDDLGANLGNHPPYEELSPVKLRATLQAISEVLQKIEIALDGPEIAPEVVKTLGQRLADLWDGLTTKMKIVIAGCAIVCVTGVSQGFLGAAGEDLYGIVKRNIDIPSFSRRLLDFGKELGKTPAPAPIFPPRPPVDV